MERSELLPFTAFTHDFYACLAVYFYRSELLADVYIYIYMYIISMLSSIFPYLAVNLRIWR